LQRTKPNLKDLAVILRGALYQVDVQPAHKSQRLT
jgi:hypothetical protein